jgi:hypothetical protein
MQRSLRTYVLLPVGGRTRKKREEKTMADVKVKLSPSFNVTKKTEVPLSGMQESSRYSQESSRYLQESSRHFQENSRHLQEISRHFQRRRTIF